MKLQKSFGTLLLGGALAVSSQLLAIKPANAATLAYYNFNGNLSNSAPTTPELSASNVGKGSGLSTATFDNRSRSGQSLYATFSGVGASTKSSAVTANTYYNFTLTPNTTPTATYGVKFGELSFYTEVGISSSTNNKGNFFVQARQGNTGAFVDLGPVFTQSSFTRTTPSTGFALHTVNLSGFVNNQYNGYFTQPVEFRIYEYDNNNATGVNGSGGGLRLDDVQLTGDVAPVPELSTGLLVALSMGALCVVGVRRKKSSPSRSMNLAF